MTDMEEILRINAKLCRDLQNYMRAIDAIKEYCKQCNLKFDFTADVILNIINKNIG